MRRILLLLAMLVGLASVAALLVLVGAHRGIRAVHPALPDPEALLAVDASEDLPTGLFMIETARQPMPRSAVLDPHRDPAPDAAYVMTHPAFVLAWPDGRLFLLDAGMDRESALAFGAPLELVMGADPIEPLGSVAERMGPALERVRGAAFSHLHTDHTAGIGAVCAARGETLRVFQLPEQHDLVNYTTRAGRAQLDGAGCVERVPLAPAALAPVPGFPGLWLAPAAGHTPGSQLLVAHLRTPAGVVVWVFTGDAVNHRDAVAGNVPKPWLYSLLVVPEDTRRLDAVRRLLADLASHPQVRLAVSHDASGLGARGVPPWPPFLREAG